MDSKKANLTPELKEIYDRVMNTTGTPKPPASQPPTPQAPTPSGSTIQPGLGQAPSQDMPSIGGNPLPPPQPDISQPQMPTAQPGGGQPQLDATGPAGAPTFGAPTPAEEALSSAPARPVTTGNSFSFSGGNVKQPQKAETAGSKKRSFISKPILIFLGIIFIAIWGVFWAIIFGLIDQ